MYNAHTQNSATHQGSRDSRHGKGKKKMLKIVPGMQQKSKTVRKKERRARRKEKRDKTHIRRINAQSSSHECSSRSADHWSEAPTFVIQQPFQAFDMTSDSALNCGLAVPRAVPEELQLSFSNATEVALQSCVHARTADEQHDAVQHLLAIPDMLPRRKAIMRTRKLLNPPKQPEKRLHQMLWRAQAARINHHITQGDVNSAIRCIDPLANLDSDLLWEAFNVSQIKHEEPDVPDESFKSYKSDSVTSETEVHGDQPGTYTTYSIKCDENILQQALKQLVSDRVHQGPSGWTAHQLQVAITRNHSTFQAAIHFVNTILKGDLPHLPDLLKASKATHRNQDGRKSALAHQEPWLQLVSTCAALSAASHPQMRDALQPRQMCFQNSKGTSSFSHAVQAGAVNHPDDVSLLLTLKDPHSSVSLQAVQDAVAIHTPELLPFVKWLYGACSTATAHEELSPTGLRPGDSFSRALISLTLSDLLKEVENNHAGIGVLAHQDAVVLQGPAAVVLSAVKDMKHLGADLGLRFTEEDYPVFPHTKAAAEGLDQLSGIVQVPGIVADGQIIAGSSQFASQHAKQRVKATDRDIKRAMGLPLPLQVKVPLLRGLVRARLSDLLAQDSAVTRSARRKLEDQAVLHLCKIMQCQESQLDRRQLLLPVRLGGSGIVELPYLHGGLANDAAYLTAAAHAQEMVKLGPPRFHPFAGKSGKKNNRKLKRLLSGLGDTGKTKLQTDFPNRQEFAALFSQLLKDSQDVRYENLLESHMDDVRNNGSPEQAARSKLDAARMRSVVHPCGHAWFNVLPARPALRLEDKEFLAGFWHMFAVVLHEAQTGQDEVKCKCGESLHEMTPGHTMTCQSFNKGWNTRHNMLQDTWIEAIEEVGFKTIKEPFVRDFIPGGIEEGQEYYGKRGDIVFWMGGEAQMTDVSVAHVSSSRSWSKAGAAALARDRLKANKYEKTPGNYVFVPLSMETYGTLGDPAEELIRRLAFEAYRRNLTQSVQEYIDRTHELLSVTLCQGNAGIYSSYHPLWIRVGEKQ